MGFKMNISKYQLSAKQVQKMNQVTMEKDKEMAGLKKKLEGMVKLNQALSAERSELLSKVKTLVSIYNNLLSIPSVELSYSRMKA